MGMALSSLYLTYGREAESLNEVLQEPVSMVSGLYFPSLGARSPFPLALQAVASLIPLTIGMDALRKTLFYGEGVGQVWFDLAVLAVMAVVLLFLSTYALKFLENLGRKQGTIAVRIR
jgi:ABC-2 type transport system permease protein